MDDQQSFNPQPKQNNSAKFAFLYMISLVALGFVAYSAGAIIFQIINKYIPNPVNTLKTYYDCFDSGVLRFSIAAIIVATPIYFIATRKINRELFMGNLDKESQIRKWLTYLIMFISSVIIIGWLIAVIYQFLDGEITARFILKAITVLAVSGTVLSYYWYDIKREITFGERNTVIRIYSWMSFMVIIAILIVGIFFVESPQEMRDKKYDQATLEILSSIDGAVNTYYKNNDTLPEDMQELLDASTIMSETSMQNKIEVNDITYSKTSGTKYELCAIFATSNQEDTNCYSYTYYLDNEWKHDIGHQCIEKVINDNGFEPQVIR
ncbi:hypothetical protein D4R87_00085 [bacterium]|nr:MAG: hypothetical protein D4R87_00085 [bacterium]